MIVHFRCSQTAKIFRRECSRKFPPEIQKVALRKLWMIDATYVLSDLRIPPSNHIEALRGSLEGRYSIRINRQWRVCFRWSNGNAYNVEIVDYH